MNSTNDSCSMRSLLDKVIIVGSTAQNQTNPTVSESDSSVCL